MSVQIDNLKAKVDTLKTAVEGLVTLTNSLKKQLDDLVAGGSLSPADTATVQGMSDEADVTLKEITDAVAADTPPAP
jgi:hypothetical protein